MKKKIFKKEIAGFTIIEMMIAISLFLIIITIGMGSLLNANLIHRKSQDMRSIMDNLSFIMEDMSRNLRTGYDYHCIDDNNFSTIDSPKSCSEGGGGIAFKSSPLGEKWVYYISSDGKIFRATQPPYSPGSGSAYVELSSKGMKISSGTFTVIGAESSDAQQPLVTIRLAGDITYKNTSTPFSLQTSVSQRLIDIGVPATPPLSPPPAPLLPPESKVESKTK